jgi:putative transposase
MNEFTDCTFPSYKRFRPGDDTPWGVMHVLNRIAGGQFLLREATEKDRFRSLLFRCAEFCGLEILTWTCLDNHYHALIRVPNDAEAALLRQAVGEEEIFARMERCFSRLYVDETRQRVTRFRSTPGQEPRAEEVIRRLRAQLYDISACMHMIQRRFSADYNKRNDRRGTLWQGRFASTLIEASEEALLRTAAYIDLNPVRAGLVDDPKDYRWCGYAEAVAGRTEPGRGLEALVGLIYPDREEDAQPAAASAHLDLYRRCLVQTGATVRDETGAIVRRGMSPASGDLPPESVQLGWVQLLQCRVRYFTASLAIGSQAFTESAFQRNRCSFSAKRKTGARRLRHGDWAGLFGLRDLRKDVICPIRRPEPVIDAA